MANYIVTVLIRNPPGSQNLKVVETAIQDRSQIRDLAEVLEASLLVVDFSVYVPQGHEKVGMDYFGIGGFKKWSHRD